MTTVIVESPEAMEAHGRSFGNALAAGSVIALVGDLGAGKTHWTKGLVAGMGSQATVTSPTFGLVHEYPGARLPVFHFDFYRLEHAQELIALGWDDYLEAHGVVIVEWADKFPELLPTATVWIAIKITATGKREIEIREP